MCSLCSPDPDRKQVKRTAVCRTNGRYQKSGKRGFISLFRRYNIVDKIDTDVTLSDARLRIYPSVLLAVPNEQLNTVYDSVLERLNSYATGGEPNNDEETDTD